MAPPPVPTAAEAAPPPPSTAEGQRSLPTPFLTKTYQLVDDPSVDDMISWNEDGSTFVVWRPAEFARDLLPKYFKHNNFSSFVRQLNTYGFRKTVPDRWEFANDCFRRGEKHLLSDIHRRKLPTSAMNAGALIPMAVPINRVGSPANSGEEQVLSSNSSPGPPPSSAAISGGPTELAEENERLRKENARLSRELSQMKSMCNHISSLISKFADEGRDGGGGGGGSGEAVAPPSTMLELMPSRRAEEEEYEDAEEDEAMAEEERSVKAEEATSAPPGPSPRLFGVTIREKRAREEEKGEALAPEVKPEPEESEAPEQHRQSWVVYCPRPVRKKSEGSDMGDGDGRTAT